MIKKFILAVLLALALSCDAKMVASPDAIIIKQINGKLYHQTRQQWSQIDSIDQITNQALEPDQWHDLIARGEPQLARALLAALGNMLTRREFLPYAFSGLNRTPDPATRPSQTVAARAYQVYSRYQDAATNARLRTHLVFNKHLEPDVYWDGLFDSGETFPTTQQAIDYLKSPWREFTGSHDWQQTKAIRTIALHRDTKDLELWMKDDHFAVALGSWLALANIKPLSVAEDIIEHALWWDAELEYTFGSGCVRSTGHLKPVVAALEIFSDHLTTQYISRVMNDIPQALDEHTLRLIKVNNHQMYRAMKSHDADLDLSHDTLSRFIARDLIKSADGFDQLLAENHVGQVAVLGLPFDARALDFARGQLEINAEGFNPYPLIRWAFSARSAHAKQFIAAFLAKPKTPKERTDWARLMLEDNPIWPIDWLDLKQQNIAVLKALDEPPTHLDLHLF